MGIPNSSPFGLDPFTGLPATVGRPGFLLARSPALPNIPVMPLCLAPAPPPTPWPRAPGKIDDPPAPARAAGPDSVTERFNDEAVGRAKPALLIPLVAVEVDVALGKHISSFALALPLTAPSVVAMLSPPFCATSESPSPPSTPTVSDLVKPKLVLGRLGGGTPSFSSAWESVERAIPRDVAANILGSDAVMVNARPFAFPGVRFIGDTGRGILDGEGRCASLDGPAAATAELDTWASPDVVIGVVKVVAVDLGLIKAFKEACLSFPVGGGRKADVDVGGPCRAAGLCLAIAIGVGLEGIDTMAVAWRRRGPSCPLLLPSLVTSSSWEISLLTLLTDKLRVTRLGTAEVDDAGFGFIAPAIVDRFFCGPVGPFAKMELRFVGLDIERPVAAE